MATAARKASNYHMLERTLLNRVRLRQLSAFVEVYEQRNILKAAKQLGLTQSTVSKSMSEMESNLEQSCSRVRLAACHRRRRVMYFIGTPRSF